MESGSFRQKRVHKILFIGPDRAELDRIESCLVRLKSSLARNERRPIQISWEKKLSSALTTLEKENFEGVILDLFLSSGQGPQALEAVQAAAPHAYVMVVATSDKEVAGSAVKREARDILVKGLLEVRPLEQALQGLVAGTAQDKIVFAEEAHAKITLDSIGDAVICTDISGRVTYLNAAAERLSGWTRAQAVGHLAIDVFRVIDSVTREPILDPLQLAIIKNKPMTLQRNAILITRDGDELIIEDTVAAIRDRNRRIKGAVVVFHDISETRASSIKMSHLAHYDFLTDLPNRVLFDDRLTQAIALARRHQRNLGVLFLDCDNLKKINDSLGHAMGDLLLQSVANRIVTAGRGSDTVSRQGGDEFVILLPEVKRAKDAVIYAKKILAAVAKPHLLGEHELHVTASIGIAMYPTDGRNAETLIRNADIALYEAKESGRNTYKTFRPGMKARAIERQSGEGRLLTALENEEFVLYYQPRVDLQTGATMGVEALIRWCDPERGIVAPADFVPIAEDSGLIVPIGRWVMREACRQAKEWRDTGLPVGTLAVNVSPVEFRSSTYLDGINNLLTEGLLDPGGIELELTESALVQDMSITSTTLQTLSSLGMRLTLDDFGTGFSSLSYLQHFAISTLKIDRSFVEKISQNARDRSLVAAIIGMAESLEIAVVAEGIETDDQVDVLRGLNCKEGQGFHFCHPLPADEFATYLSASLN